MLMFFPPCVLLVFFGFFCRPALMNVFLLEVHPSLCLASAVYHGLVQAHTELCQLHRATSITDKLHLEHKAGTENLEQPDFTRSLLQLINTKRCTFLFRVCSDYCVQKNKPFH